MLAHKPKGANETRAHMATLTILDTGMRASELLGIIPDAIDGSSEEFVGKLEVAGAGESFHPSGLPATGQTEKPIGERSRP